MLVHAAAAGPPSQVEISPPAIVFAPIAWFADFRLPESTVRHCFGGLGLTLVSLNRGTAWWHIVAHCFVCWLFHCKRDAVQTVAGIGS